MEKKSIGLYFPPNNIMEGGVNYSRYTNNENAFGMITEMCVRHKWKYIVRDGVFYVETDAYAVYMREQLKGSKT